MSESEEPKVENLGEGAGYIVHCGMCGTEIWVYEYDEDLVYICGPCADTLPE
jgi:hypothetical protein